MKSHKLTKLSGEDLSSICGGQIYKAWDKEEKAFCYLVPSATVYATYYNETEAKNNAGHLKREDIVECSDYSDAVSYAEADCTCYKIIKAWS